jgi:SSS family transporter
MKTMVLADYIAIFAYLIFVLFIGFFVSRFQKGGKDYFAGGNKIPWWISGISLYMTNFSAYTFVGLAGLVYLSGYYAIIGFLGSPLAYIIAGFAVGGLWRRTRAISPVEYTETRFNVTTQQSVGIALSLCHMLTCGAQLFAVAFITSCFCGIPIPITILVIGIVVILYTYWGGMWAVSIADVVQFAILLAITAVVAPLSISLVKGGLVGLIDSIPPLSLHHTIGSTHYDVHWILATFIATTIGTASGMGPRFFSVVDEKAAKKVGILAGLLFLTFPILFFVPPLVARAIWPEIGDIPQALAQLRSRAPQEFVFIAIVNKVLPVGLLGVFVAAMLAATMDGLSAFYNFISSIVSRDVYKGLVKPNATDEQLLKVGKIATLIVGVIVTGLALSYYYSGRDIFGIMTRILAIFAAPAGVSIAFGLLIKRLPRWSAVASFAWGFLASIVAQLILNWGKWSLGYQIYLSLGAATFILLFSYHVGKWYKEDKSKLLAFSILSAAIFGFFLVLGTLEPMTSMQQISVIASSLVIGASVWLFGYLFSSETESEKEMVNNFFKKLATPIDVATEVLGRGVQERSAFFLVGIITTLFGGIVAVSYVTLLITGVVTSSDGVAFLSVAGVLIVIGLPIFFFGRRYRPELIDKVKSE